MFFILLFKKTYFKLFCPKVFSSSPERVYKNSSNSSVLFLYEDYFPTTAHARYSLHRRTDVASGTRTVFITSVHVLIEIHT